MAGELVAQVNTGVTAETKATLRKIREKHRITETELARALIEEACRFYDEHGFFSLPVVIHPEAFQAQWVAETQAAYGGATKPHKPPDKSQRTAGAGPAHRVPKSA